MPCNILSRASTENFTSFADISAFLLFALIAGTTVGRARTMKIIDPVFFLALGLLTACAERTGLTSLRREVPVVGTPSCRKASQRQHVSGLPTGVTTDDAHRVGVLR